VGNPGGPGNPHAEQVGRLRSALLNAVTEEDIRQVVSALIGKAKSGDVHAARILFDRVLGKPIEADLLSRIEALERQTGGE
jgi:ribosomal protein L17